MDAERGRPALREGDRGRGDRPPEAVLGAFLAVARRRYLLRTMLAVAGASGACGLLFTFGARVLNRVYRLEIPGVSFGLALFVVLVAAGLRSARLPRVAREADRSLRLHDRLATFLDFGARADVAPEFRAAQAREAAAFVVGLDPSRGVALPRLLWAAPLLFGWLLYVDFFEFFTPFTTIFQAPGRGVVQRRAAGGEGDEPNLSGDTPPPGAPEVPRPAEPAAPEPPSAQRDQTSEPEATADADRPEEEGGGEAAGVPQTGSASAVFNEPPQLFSEPVGRELTPVDEAGGGGGPPGSGLDLPPRGRISFDIVPTEGAGEGPGGDGPGSGRAGGLRITIDYDAVPAEYRVQVRRYFNALVRLFQGGTDGA